MQRGQGEGEDYCHAWCPCLQLVINGTVGEGKRGRRGKRGGGGRGVEEL